jgi:hypothetical protein
MVIPTPHIAAGRGDFAELVLMPGDPLRARHLAEALLRDAREVSAVRNMLAYTGRWRGQPVSIMGSGMGIPSLSIYATELAREYGVRRVVRIGTCGALQDSLALGDLVLAAGAGTDSRVNRLRCRGHDLAALASVLFRKYDDQMLGLSLRSCVASPRRILDTPSSTRLASQADPRRIFFNVLTEQDTGIPCSARSRTLRAEAGSRPRSAVCFRPISSITPIPTSSAP